MGCLCTVWLPASWAITDVASVAVGMLSNALLDGVMFAVVAVMVVRKLIHLGKHAAR